MDRPSRTPAQVDVSRPGLARIRDESLVRDPVPDDQPMLAGPARRD